MIVRAIVDTCATLNKALNVSRQFSASRDQREVLLTVWEGNNYIFEWEGNGKRKNCQSVNVGRTWEVNVKISWGKKMGRRKRF